MEFGILGPLAVWQDGRELELGAAKQRALLAALLLHAGEAMSTERLVDALWGERPPATAVKALQVHVSQLRKVLGDGVVETRPMGYVVRVEPGELDSQRFESLLEQGRQLMIAGDAAGADELLRGALELWRGPPLAEFEYEMFARNEIGRLEELRLAALELRLEADLAVGRHAEAIAELEALVRDHPLRENLRRLLILALYRAGRQADALAVMQDARASLRDELGLDPSQALQQLEKAILLQDPSLLPVGATLAEPAPPHAEPAPPSIPPSRPAAPAPVCAACSTINAYGAGFCHACGAPLVADASLETRKTVTVLFCDVVAFTELAGRIDPEALRNVMSRFFDLAAATIERHGGTVEKFIGDEVMAVFGVPAVREDDALRSVRAAVELRDAIPALETELAGTRLEVRIGINSGEVVAGDHRTGHGFVTGEPVALGKRLQQRAAAGEIVLGETTYALIAHAVEAAPLELLKVKGKSDEVKAFRLESVDSDATALPRRDDAPLVDRHAELEWLKADFAAVGGGEGARVVTILGEPGIGKSRLAREFVGTVSDEATVLVGRCPPYGEAITFWPLRELLRGAGRDEALAAGNSYEIFAATRQVLAELAAERPVVAVFEDVHWAESTFLDLVEYLGARLGEAPVLLLCLARPQLAERRPAWLQPPADARVLNPLSEADSQVLLEALGAPAAVRDRIADTAEGNPLFVEQLAAITDERSSPAMPSSIRGVLHARLDRLERAERAALQRAAVVGRSFSLEAVLELTELDEREHLQARLHELVRKGLLRPDRAGAGEGFRFAHALVRETAFDALPKATAAELHERMADRLESQAAGDALVGNHLEHAYRLRRELGRVDRELGARAGHLLRAAGHERFGRSDLPATISFFERAQALLPDDDAALPALLTELGYARIKSGDFAAAETDLDAAVDAAVRLHDRAAELHALVERQFARYLVAEGTTGDENVRLAREVMPELELLGDELGLARAWWLKSESDALACRWLERAEALEQALAHAHRAETGLDVAGTVSGLLSLALLYGPTPVPDAITRVEELLLEAGSDPALRATVSASLAGLLAMRGEADRARSLYADAAAIYEELGLRLRRATRAHIGSRIALLAGEPVAAEAELRTANDVLIGFGAHGIAAVHAGLLADLLAQRASFDEAEAIARELAESLPEDDLAPQVLWRTALGRVLAARGDLAEAERLTLEALALTEGIEFPEICVTALTAAFAVRTAQGRDDDARKLLADARRIIEAKGDLAGLRQLDAATATAVP